MAKFIRYIVCVAFGLTLGLSITLSGQENAQQSSSKPNYPLLIDIISTVETYYVDKISQQELIEAAIEGIFSKLDPYSNFLDKDAFSDLRNANSGEYFGFGIEIATLDDKVTIISPFPHSPAAVAGILPGDRIIKVNNENVSAKHLDNVLKQIRFHSQHNLAINLSLSRSNSDAIFDVTLKPTVINVHSLTTELLSDGIGYVKLSSFQDDSTEDLIKQLNQWQNKPLTGIILDLRNNPGGLLDQAVKIADLFLAKGRIVSTRGRFFDANSDYFASPQNMFSKLPIIVLINKGSASASEVLAAALQENKRAILIGEKSFGKGTVQSIIPTLIDGNAIKLTIAHYTTPKGRDIHSVGIEPDINITTDAINNNQSMPIIDELSPRDNLAQDKFVKSAITWIKTKT
ncbi:S41 family peptidase [Shewanella psychrotolerans]|uniref:S41 family peptidase n=1 Tax=Shewanella psychrotolerans TaxID=2864206 RepID=UPI001C659C87|nr:S41 family peptidase [Shewanella psychrotolerans]QYK01381.1 S41 family peptidase [Shewanella psychrotolerans]